jgi:hypothetical protein
MQVSVAGHLTSKAPIVRAIGATGGIGLPPAAATYTNQISSATTPCFVLQAKNFPRLAPQFFVTPSEAAHAIARSVTRKLVLSKILDRAAGRTKIKVRSHRSQLS